MSGTSYPEPSPVTPGSLVHLWAVTPSDTTVFSPATRALYVGGAGNVAVVGEQDSESGAVTFVGVPAGTWLGVSVQQVLATGTTATDIVAGW